MSQLPRDPVIEEIREVRHRISERFDHDPKRLLEYYMRLQEEHRDRFIAAAKQTTKVGEG
jgi:hypothetical protein